MTVTQTVEKVDFVAIKAGKELPIKAANDLAAEMLVRTYVPEYDPAVMTWQKAVTLAEMRDERAAYELEASVKAALDFEEDSAEDGVAAEVVNMLLETAETSPWLYPGPGPDNEEDPFGPWEVQGL